MLAPVLKLKYHRFHVFLKCAALSCINSIRSPWLCYINMIIYYIMLSAVVSSVKTCLCLWPFRLLFSRDSFSSYFCSCCQSCFRIVPFGTVRFGAWLCNDFVLGQSRLQVAVTLVYRVVGAKRLTTWTTILNHTIIDYCIHYRVNDWLWWYRTVTSVLVRIHNIIHALYCFICHYEQIFERGSIFYFLFSSQQSLIRLTHGLCCASVNTNTRMNLRCVLHRPRRMRDWITCTMANNI